MRAVDILEAIGEIDEKDILAAERKKTKPIAIWMSSLAAALVLVFMLPGIVMNLIGYGAAGDMDPGVNAPNENFGDMQAPTTPDSDEGESIAFLDVIGTTGTHSVTDASAVVSFEAMVEEITRTSKGQEIAVLPDGGLGEGEYRIVFVAHTGERYEYRLQDNVFTCVYARKRYTLTSYQTDEMKTILCISD